MPIDPQRLSRVRAHFLAAAALVTAGCGSSMPEHTINDGPREHTPPPTESPSAEPVHINRPATEAPTASPTASPAQPPPGNR